MVAPFPRRVWFPLVVAILALLHGCTGGPDPADIAADRDRWDAVRLVSVDGSIDAQEAPLLAELLVRWDDKLTAAERAAGRARDPAQQLRDLLRVYGLAAVQLFVAPELQARAPESFRLFDRNGDGMLDEAELLAIDPRDPVFAMVVASTVHGLIKNRGKVRP